MLPYELVVSGRATLTTYGREINEVSSVRDLLATHKAEKCDIEHKKQINRIAKYGFNLHNV